MSVRRHIHPNSDLRGCEAVAPPEQGAHPEPGLSLKHHPSIKGPQCFGEVVESWLGRKGRVSRAHLAGAGRRKVIRKRWELFQDTGTNPKALPMAKAETALATTVLDFYNPQNKINFHESVLV